MVHVPSPAVELSQLIWLSIICLRILQSFASKQMSASCFSGMVWTWTYWKVCNNWSKLLEKFHILFHCHQPNFLELLQEIWIWCTFIKRFDNSEIFFYDFENIFPYFLIWSRNKFEPLLNFQNINWLKDIEKLKYFLPM